MDYTSNPLLKNGRFLRLWIGQGTSFVGDAVSMVALVILVVQIVLVRPRLARRSDRVLAGNDAPRSNAHYWYVGLEVVKVVALLITGVFLLTT